MADVLTGGMYGAITDRNGTLAHHVDLWGSKAAEKANTARQKSEDIAWEREMEASNTAHQREVEDLKKAGLNPILSAGGRGASTPATGGVEVENTQPGGMMGRLERTLNTASAIANIANIKSATELNKEQNKIMEETGTYPGMPTMSSEINESDNNSIGMGLWSTGKGKQSKITVPANRKKKGYRY
jgi:hypothetical protein